MIVLLQNEQDTQVLEISKFLFEVLIKPFSVWTFCMEYKYPQKRDFKVLQLLSFQCNKFEVKVSIVILI